MALGVVRAARDLGLTIPGDLSLIAHDDVFPWLKPENFSGAAVDDALVDPRGRRAHRRAAGGAHLRAGGRARAARSGRSIWWCAARSPARRV